MKVVHRVSFSPKDGELEAFSSLNLQLEDHSNEFVKLVIFEIDELDPTWPKVEGLIKKFGLSDFIGTKFTEEELNSANFLKIDAGTKGYPLPDRDFGYRKVSCDLSSYCEDCGIGLNQNAPYRIKGEPKWGKSHVFALEWVFDAFFVPPHIWEIVFRPFGIGKVDVLDRNGQKVLNNVVQLEIQNSQSPMEVNKYPFEVCSRCGRKRYYPITRGFLPPFNSDPGHLIFKTQEWFGSGRAAGRRVIVSNELYKTIQKSKLVGFRWYPDAGDKQAKQLMNR